MSVLTPPEVEPETGWRPLMVGEVDLAGPPAFRRITPAADETSFTAALVLVRRHGEPLGTVEVPVVDGRVSPVALTEAIASQLGDVEHDEPRSTTPPAADDQLPLVSVAIATRDRPDTVVASIDSILANDYPHLDIIVVDNAPGSDETERLVKGTYGAFPSVRYVREERPGLARARNCGLAHARGRIVVFTDDDITVDRGWVRAIVRGFNRSPGVTCVTGLIMPAELSTPAQGLLEQYGGFNKGFRPRLWNLDEHREPDPLYPYTGGRFGSGANMAFATEPLRRLGGFDDALGAGTPARGGEDLEAFIRVILRGGSIAYEPAALIWHTHYRTYDRLRSQLRNYGVGLTAALTGAAVGDLRSAGAIARRAPRGIALVMRRSSTKNAAKGTDFPPELDRLERMGMVAGPGSYLRSRRWARRTDLDPTDDPTADGNDGQPRWRRLRRRVTDHLRVPLFRNAYALIANTGLTGLIGFAYWVLAARHYPTSEVGRGAALISTMVLIAAFAELNLDGALTRFLPRAGSRARRLVLGAYGVSAALAVVGATAFVGFERIFGEPGSVLRMGPATAVWFIVAVIAWCIFTHQDSVLAGLRKAVWVPAENLAFGVLKVVLLAVLMSSASAWGLFASWTLPVIISVVPVNWLIFRKLLPRHAAAAKDQEEALPPRTVVRFVAGDYAGSLFKTGSFAILPILVLTILGPTEAAFFYVALQVDIALSLLVTNLGTSLTVEGAADEGRLRELAISALRRSAVLFLPLVGIIVIAAPLILSVFGRAYAADSTDLLRLLALALVPKIVTSTAVAVARVERRVARIVAIEAVAGIITVGLAAALLGPLGIVGAGLGVLVGNTVVAVGLLPWLGGLLRRPRPTLTPAVAG